ncbi:MAG: protein-glutamate O-methyltransferase CheR [Planctomycetes bacterium]|nr:protein-glutamate O-methyltransferase CheR [Planctomycetota bacterium]
MKLRPGEMKLMQQLVLQLSGIALDTSKAYLIETRLGHLAERAGASNFNELYFMLRHGGDRELVREVVDAITTHETTWFRDPTAFGALERRVLPSLLEARERAGVKRLRIWSAACSSGQEPYSVAMLLHELLPDLDRWDVQILGTDISTVTLERASRGVYSEHEMNRTSRPGMMLRYFEQTPEGSRVIPSVRSLVEFRERNLLLPMQGVGPFDLVLLRNVLIYFAPATRDSIVQRVAGVMRPDGYLLAGGSESLREGASKLQATTIGGVPFYRPLRAPRAPA